MIRSLWIARTALMPSRPTSMSSPTTWRTSRPTASSVAVRYSRICSTRRSANPAPSLPSRRRSLRVCSLARACGRRRRHASLRRATLEQTGNVLDLAINGAGFFQITLPDGNDRLRA